MHVTVLLAHVDVYWPARFFHLQGLGYACGCSDSVPRTRLPSLHNDRRGALVITRWLRAPADPPDHVPDLLVCSVFRRVIEYGGTLSRAAKACCEVCNLFGETGAFVIKRVTPGTSQEQHQKYTNITARHVFSVSRKQSEEYSRPPSTISAESPRRASHKEHSVAYFFR